MRRYATAVIMMLTLLLLVLPDSALAVRAWVEGGASGHPLGTGQMEDVVVVKTGSAPGVKLERKILWQYRAPGEDFDPFSADVLPSGNVLVASRSNEVFEITRGGRVVWSYTRLDDNPDLSNINAAQRLPNGNTLITDRRADFVIEVNPAKKVVWRYGANPNSTGPGSLIDPFSAQRLPNGNTLIAENRGGNRVIEVRSSDYDPSAPNLGYTESSIVWSYGQTGVPGLAPNQLMSPRHAVRLSNGNTLITDSSASQDSAYGHRVIEVTPDHRTVWSFGEPGVAGGDDTHLNGPSAAQRLSNGNTLSPRRGTTAFWRSILPARSWTVMDLAPTCLRADRSTLPEGCIVRHRAPWSSTRETDGSSSTDTRQAARSPRPRCRLGCRGS